MSILQDDDVVKPQVKNPIHAVANVDDYSGSARLLAGTTLRSSSFIVDAVIVVSVTLIRSSTPSSLWSPRKFPSHIPEYTIGWEY